MLRRTSKAVLPVALVPVLLAGCGGDDDQPTRPAAPAALEVKIEDFKFVPQQAKVKAGGTITFVNRDKAPHTAEAPTFDTDRLDRGDSKQIKLETPGTYEYFCDFHRFMTGTVEVTE